MKTAVFAFSRQGCATARRAAAALGAAALYAPARLEAEGFAPIAPPLADFAGAVFRQVDAMVFVGACGIAVRAIAPHVRDKRTDPAVLAVDETARFVIPLLSGHIGGANALARRLGEALGAVPAVTTATDVNGRFSVDTWAAEKGLFIDGMAQAKAVSAAILEGPVPLASDFPVDGPLPSGVAPGEAGPVGICISWRQRRPFGQSGWASAAAGGPGRRPSAHWWTRSWRRRASTRRRCGARRPLTSNGTSPACWPSAGGGDGLWIFSQQRSWEQRRGSSPRRILSKALPAWTTSVSGRLCWARSGCW